MVMQFRLWNFSVWSVPSHLSRRWIWKMSMPKCCKLCWILNKAMHCSEIKVGCDDIKEDRWRMLSHRWQMNDDPFVGSHDPKRRAPNYYDHFFLLALPSPWSHFNHLLLVVTLILSITSTRVTSYMWQSDTSFCRCRSPSLRNNNLLDG